MRLLDRDIFIWSISMEVFDSRLFGRFMECRVMLVLFVIVMVFLFVLLIVMKVYFVGLFVV